VGVQCLPDDAGGSALQRPAIYSCSDAPGTRHPRVAHCVVPLACGAPLRRRLPSPLVAGAPRSSVQTAPRPCGSLTVVVPLACGALLRRRLPSSLVAGAPRSSVQTAPRPCGSLTVVVPLARGAPLRRRLPSSLVAGAPRSSVQTAPRPCGSLTVLPHDDPSRQPPDPSSYLRQHEGLVHPHEGQNLRIAITACHARHAPVWRHGRRGLTSPDPEDK